MVAHDLIFFKKLEKKILTLCILYDIILIESEVKKLCIKVLNESIH